MATFPSLDPTEATPRTNIRTISAKFGDGYSQRTPDGINSVERSWDLKWVNITTAEAESIDDFLVDKAGVTAFDWTPPKTSTAYKWICRQWDWPPVTGGYQTVTAVFEQVFDL